MRNPEDMIPPPEAEEEVPLDPKSPEGKAAAEEEARKWAPLEKVIAQLPPDKQAGVLHAIRESEVGTLRLTQATMELRTHSRNLLLWTKVLVCLTAVLALLSGVLIYRTLAGP